MEHSERQKLEKLLQIDQNKFLRELKRLIADGDSRPSCSQSLHMLDIIKTQGRSDVLEVMIDGESLLHTAAKFHRNFTVMDALITRCPKLVTLERSEEYEGQTVLHILIAKGDTKNVKNLFAHPKVDQKAKKILLQKRATGEHFHKTILMGETPLSVAALTLEKDMVSFLLTQGALIEQTTKKRGETVLHTLVRYAYRQGKRHANKQFSAPGNECDVNRYCREHVKENSCIQECVIEMLKLLHEALLGKKSGDKVQSEDELENAKKVWLTENDECMTALSLAALLGEDKIFSYIMNLPGVYRFFCNRDGIFDMEMFDITEIDTIARRKYLKLLDKRDLCKPLCCPDQKDCWFRFLPHSRKPSTAILEEICTTDVSSACRIVSTPVIKNLLKRKWKNYRIYFYLWSLFNLVCLALLTAYAVFKAKVIASLNAAEKGNNTTTAESCNCYTASAEKVNSIGEAATAAEEDFVKSVCWLSCAGAIGLLVIEFIRTFCLRKPWKLRAIHHNGNYRIILVLMSVCLILDTLWYWSSPATNRKGLLVFAVLFGWYFTTFFLRPFKRFSFFTIMLQKIIFGDVLRFSTLFLIELVSFTTAMHMTFLHSQPVPEEFHSFGRSMLTMFRLMLGLSEIEILTQAEEAWLSVLLFVFFVILTYVLLMNSLIALMSNTCSDLSNRTELFYLQRMSVILFMEDMMASNFVRAMGKEDEKTGRSYMGLRNGHAKTSNEKDFAWRERYVWPVGESCEGS